MDFLDPVKKRAHNRRLFIGYFLMGVAILMASAILAMLSYGYDFDRKTGEVIQNGLIFTATEPESANIYLNGKENGSTDKRLTVPAGDYNVEFRRSGYRSWNKKLKLEGSSIERLVYARLFPEKLNQAEAAVYDTNPGFSTQSPDRRWLLVGKAGEPQTYYLFDTANPEDEPKTLQLPGGILTSHGTGTHAIELVEWSSDNRHVLLDHTYDDKHEFIMLDRQVIAESVNINKHLGIEPTEISLRDKKFDELYVLNAADATLSRANTKSKQITKILDYVTTYKSYQDDLILYATSEPTAPGKTLVKVWDDGTSYTLRTLNETDVLLDLARFDGAWYVAVVPVKENRMLIYKNPFGRLKDKPKTEIAPFAAMKITNPAFLSFSANTRFVAVQSGATFAVYDFETDRRYNFKTTGEVPAELKARWMDGHRLTLNQANKVVVFEFDGGNRQELAAIVPGSLPYFDRDYERLYTLMPAKDDAVKTAVTRTSLKLDVEP